MNPMIEFAKSNRTTTYFRDQAINQIRIAYRIMEYLAPDECFMPTASNITTKNYILSKDFTAAFASIIEEIDFHDCNCSSGYEGLKSQAVELMEYLLPIYMRNQATAKEKRRMELLKELQELDNDGQKK